jgi:hypothetical protein
VTITPFDPFQAISGAPKTKSWPSWRLLLTFPLVFAVAIVVTLFDGTLGSAGSLQPLEDMQRVFRIGHVTASKPAFPFLRDFASWIVFAIIVLTIALVHRQWKAMRGCLGRLSDSGVLVLKATPTVPNGWPRWLRIHRLAADKDDAMSLDQLVNRLNGILRALSNATLLFGGSAAALVFLLVLSEQRNGIFGVLAPQGFTAAGQRAWLRLSYQSWWAGTNHLPGLILYCACACLGIYVVLMQNVVGVVTVYLTVFLPLFADFGMDWNNVDGHFGWSGVSDGYRTVLWSLTLRGFALSFLFIVLGVRNFEWITALLAIWAAVLPLYTIVPFQVFGRIGRDAVERRILSLLKEQGNAEALGDPRSRLLLSIVIRQEIRELRTYHSMILRPRPIETSLAFGTIVLPIGLAIAQIVFSLQFGGR